MKLYGNIFSNPDAHITNKLDFTGLKILDTYSHNIKKSAVEDLSIKKKFYRDERYLSVLEREYIYFYEGTKSLVKAFANYLIKGEPVCRTADEIEDFIYFTRSSAKNTVIFHLKYLSDDCNGCPVHDEHGDYKEMKRCKYRLSGTEDYIKTLEESYIEEQTSNYFARIFLEIVLQNRPYFAGSCSKESPEYVQEIVKSRVKFYGLACIGKIPIYDSPWI
ncbi:MAG: hypothetical protein Q7K21_04595 [Elusimicrobiota bacterium]|nr:hypothetical protein [Elusimicrobiota bacterium]